MDSSTSASVKDDDIKKSKFSPVLLFIPKGPDMSPIFLEGAPHLQGAKKRASERGATVLDSSWDINSEQIPTHIVVSDRAGSRDAAVVAEAMGLTGDDAVQEFCAYLKKHAIECVERRWAVKGHGGYYPPFQRPKPTEKVYYYTVKSPDRRLFPPSTPSGNNKRPRNRVEDEDEDESVTEPRKIQAFNNHKLSTLFHTLSKLYQSAPKDENDPWRSYTFHLVSGRLKRLPEITIDNVSELRKIPAVGDSCIKIAKEFLLNNGTGCARLTFMQTDPERLALRELVKIYGVGRVKARELVALGYYNIQQVRKSIEKGDLKMDRNQLIGVEIYDDIQEDMTRKEVELICSKVSDAVQRRLKNAELQLMGSYRRGKTECGDVDILITHPDYVDSVPPRLLGEVVDDLCRSGEIAYHLTFLSGMRPEKFETLPPEAAQQMTDPKHHGRHREKKEKTRASYMGVFFSPLDKKKRRRVDIKFYPYRERIFACLYFTGSGHFNRSMRLFAERKKDFRLSDLGLFVKNTDIRVTEKSKNGQTIDFEPRTEKDIFDKIGIRWKEPHERDGFDAVEGQDGSVLDEDLSRSELTKENATHAWIK